MRGHTLAAMRSLANHAAARELAVVAVRFMHCLVHQHGLAHDVADGNDLGHAAGELRQLHHSAHLDRRLFRHGQTHHRKVLKPGDALWHGRVPQGAAGSMRDMRTPSDTHTRI